MLYFDHKGKRYHLKHDFEDDSRRVVECEDFDFKPLVTFDKELWAIVGKQQVGRLAVDSPTDEWTLVMFDDDNTVHRLDVNCHEYSWQRIMRAEVEAAKILIG